ncbi:hypothetical protein DFQ30_002575 [Apophysomyces sp. BC1015]|nr:hypothetical protein DFQ30_002575 [Apophysomyces sp. BC1015]KAG0177373.1 hypothetical protein DFQ29_004921 [Apophysomyces sp. BC1021]
MSSNNNPEPNRIRGPTSALSSFLREHGIHVENRSRRTRRQRNEQEQRQQAEDEINATVEGSGDQTEATMGEEREDTTTATATLLYAPGSRRRTRSAAADAVIAQANKRKKKKDSDDEMSENDQEGAAGPSTPRRANPGRTRIAFCAFCNKRFSQMSNETQKLCSACADKKEEKPIKKIIKRRRVPRNQRTAMNGATSQTVPTLQDLCINIVARHIMDVEALGDISFINMDKIAKIICRNRQLTSQTARLFMGPKVRELNLYDCANVDEVGLLNIAHFCVNAQTLKLVYCGRMTDNVLLTYATRLKQLRSIGLSGPFLISEKAWKKFFETVGSQLESFDLSDTMRFTTGCLNSLAKNCPNLRHLRLSRLDKMHEEWLGIIAGVECLETLELGWPPQSHQLSTNGLLTLLECVGNNLTELSLLGCPNVNDDLLINGILKHCPKLQVLVLPESTSITPDGVQTLFNEWKTGWPGRGLTRLELAGCRNLDDDALKAVIRHSGRSLTHLDVHSLDRLTATGLEALAEEGPEGISCQELEYLDCGFVRAMDDFVLQKLVKTCSSLKYIKVWGCYQLTESVQLHRGLRVEGREQERF